MKNALLFLFVILMYYGCQNHEEHDSSAHEHHHHSAPLSTLPIKLPDAATASMIEKVQAQVSKIDPNKITYYLNNDRAVSIAQRMKSETGIALINSKLQYARELLNAGKTEESIQVYQSILDEVTNTTIDNAQKTILQIKRNLAVAYMRKAEQDNCLANHTAESCIIPISKNGQHQLKEGALKTIELLNEILVANPNDKECKYLLTDVTHSKFEL
jgi:rubrerythrin